MNFNKVFKVNEPSHNMVKNNDAERIYTQLAPRLCADTGKIIAIDVDTGDYFVGKNIMDAYQKGHKKYPHKEFYFKRIGSKTTFVVGKV